MQDVIQIDGNEVTAFGQVLPPLKDQLIEHYLQPKPLDKSKVPDLEKMGLKLEPFQFCTLPVNDIPPGAPMVGQVRPGGTARRLNWQQFKAIYEAVGSSGGWWPLTDKKHYDPAYVFDMELYLLSKTDGTPVGMGCVCRNYHDKPERAGICYIGVTPSQQGKGYGSALLKNLLEIAWKDTRTKEVGLCTIPELDKMAGGSHATTNPAAVLYTKCGFELQRSQRHGPEDGELWEINLPDYYKAEVAHAGLNPDTDLNGFYEGRLVNAFTAPKSLRRA